jgi:small neutral amino acid transporter SnatA (MarC family)
MVRELSLFTGTFTTLLAIINPLEVLPVYLQLLAGKDDATHRAVAKKACVYALLLCFFFLLFGTLMLSPTLILFSNSTTMTAPAARATPMGKRCGSSIVRWMGMRNH